MNKDMNDREYWEQQIIRLTRKIRRIEITGEDKWEKILDERVDSGEIMYDPEKEIYVFEGAEEMEFNREEAIEEIKGEKEDVFFKWERAIKKIPLNKDKQKPIIIISETNKKTQYQVDISDEIGKKQGYKIMKDLVEIFEKGEKK